jgi:hypothetical protein
MEQEILKPGTEPKAGTQAFSPFGCFIAAFGITLLAFCLWGAAFGTTIWAVCRLLGLPNSATDVLIGLALVPTAAITIWTAGRAWHVERRLAQHQDIDVPVFKLFHYFNKA